MWLNGVYTTEKVRRREVAPAETLHQFYSIVESYIENYNICASLNYI